MATWALEGGPGLHGGHAAFAVAGTPPGPLGGGVPVRARCNVPAGKDSDEAAARRRALLREATMSISKPEIDFPGGEPPAELHITEIWEGDGEVAKPGDTVQVHYVGVAYSTGEEFDASWDRGEPLEFRLGAGKVISGWDQGVAGA